MSADPRAVNALSQYAAYHRDQRNIASHFVGIPLIWLAIAVLLARPTWGSAPLLLSPLLPVGVFAAVYFLWVMASLIGYMMYQHHGALEIDLLREPEPDAASAAARRVKPEAQVRDAEVSALVQKSDLKDAASGVLA